MNSLFFICDMLFVMQLDKKITKQISLHKFREGIRKISRITGSLGLKTLK